MSLIGHHAHALRLTDDEEHFRIRRAPPCAMPDEFKVAAPPELSGIDTNESSTREEKNANSMDTSLSLSQPASSDALKPLLDKDQQSPSRKRKRSEEKGKERRPDNEDIEDYVDQEDSVSPTMPLNIEIQSKSGATEEEEVTINRKTTTQSSHADIIGEDEEIQRLECLLTPIEDEVAGALFQQ